MRTGKCGDFRKARCLATPPTSQQFHDGATIEDLQKKVIDITREMSRRCNQLKRKIK
jgi:hypothetical protein